MNSGFSTRTWRNALWILSASIALSDAAGVRADEPVPCLRPRLAVLGDRISSWFDAAPLDREAFEGYKAGYLKLLKRGKSFEVPKRLDATRRLALLEATAEYVGHDLSVVSKTLEVGSPAARRKIAARLEKLIRNRAHGGIDLKELRSFVAEAMELQHPELMKRLASVPPELIDQAMERWAMGQLVGGDIEKVLKQLALDDLTLPKGLRKARVTLTQWKDRHANLIESLQTISVGSASWLVPHAPLYVPFPKWALLPGKQIPEEILTILRTQGYEAARPLIEKQFGSAARFDLYWKRVGTAVGVGMFGVIGYYLVDSFVLGDDPEPGEAKRDQAPPNPRAWDPFVDQTLGGMILSYHELDSTGGWPDPEGPEVDTALQKLTDSINEGDFGYTTTKEELKKRFIQVLKDKQAESF